MVSEDRIEEEGLTTEDVLKYETVEPQEGVEWLPEWDDHPEERPGENTRIEDDTLIWEKEGFEARLTHIEPTKWRAVVDVPPEYGETYAREIDVKCKPIPEHGFVESADTEDYELQQATLVLSENFQPIREVNRFIEKLIEDTEGFKEFQEDLENKLAAARENEE
ncbi:hypothetical protein G9464_20830 [Halostella sp. JP-L12]|uniref:hypothetical protein n=1 Tax=Halostella TaxID=1843185 RepID=UPI000EF7F611|nr:MULTISPECIES: hypothetical protein [Halostella]NHN50017.1 hypothetical protein [Halostella sp. JP-L12]